MSERWTSFLWNHGPIRHIDRYVMLCIAFFADERGMAWLPVSEIVERTRCAESTVRQSLKRLERDGFVERVESPFHGSFVVFNLRGIGPRLKEATTKGKAL